VAWHFFFLTHVLGGTYLNKKICDVYVPGKKTAIEEFSVRVFRNSIYWNREESPLEKNLCVFVWLGARGNASDFHIVGSLALLLPRIFPETCSLDVMIWSISVRRAASRRGRSTSQTWTRASCSVRVCDNTCLYTASEIWQGKQTDDKQTSYKLQQIYTSVHSFLKFLIQWKKVKLYFLFIYLQCMSVCL